MAAKPTDEVSMIFRLIYRGEVCLDSMTPHPPQAVPLLPQEKAIVSFPRLIEVRIFYAVRFGGTKAPPYVLAFARFIEVRFC